MNNGTSASCGPLSVAVSEGRWAARNLNTILISVVLFVLSAGGGSLAKMSWDNAITLAKMEGSLVTKNDLELKIATLKADVDMKIAEANTRTLALDKDLTALKLALAERGITGRK